MFIIFEGLRPLIGYTPDDVLSTVKNVRLLAVRKLWYPYGQLIFNGYVDNIMIWFDCVTEENFQL
jgi:hypothetical protein